MMRGEQPLGWSCRRRPAGDHVAGSSPSPCRAKTVLDLGRGEQAPGHLLVVDPPFEQLLGGMAERGVPEVVEQRGGAHQPPLAAAGRPRAGAPPLLPHRVS